MSTVITVEELGKKYLLKHQSGQQPYVALRDVLSDGVKNLCSKLLGRGNTASRGVEKEEFWALKDVSFEVRQGDRIAIIGRNGAGKSTLLKILSRITEPTTGSVSIKGRLASLLEVGTGFHPELTGRENIYLNGAILGMGRVEIRKKFDEIVDFAEIEKFLDTPVKRYSSGMYVRLAFAVAAHLEPEILVVDEVLAVGDAQFQKKCVGKMEDVSNNDGKTLLIVSHNIPVINNLCNQALLLNSGEIVKRGESSEVIKFYLENKELRSSKVVWKDVLSAPGNEVVRLHSIVITQNGAECLDSYINIDSEVTIRISYFNLKDGAKLYAALWLKDKMGVEVLSSGNSKYINMLDDEWSEKPHPVGLFHAHCTFPANFFNEGHYSVTAIVGLEPSNTQILLRDAVSFEVIDTGDMRKNYLGGWLGVIRPKLAWHTIRESMND